MGYSLQNMLMNFFAQNHLLYAPFIKPQKTERRKWNSTVRLRVLGFITTKTYLHVQLVHIPVYCALKGLSPDALAPFLSAVFGFSSIPKDHKEIIRCFL